MVPQSKAYCMLNKMYTTSHQTEIDFQFVQNTSAEQKLWKKNAIFICSHPDIFMGLNKRTKLFL